MNRRLSLLAIVPSLVAAAACGSATKVPAVGPDRPSGQSSLMDKTTAGANRCDPKNQDRPFVIEWDATDMSSFEARAASDVVFVKYEGCKLTVLDGCANDSIKGAFGTYAPPDWTSGSVEKIDIANEGELYAKLPLGVSTLGGRVQAGEQFHMEYYVSGTRRATRDEIYRKDIEPFARCRGATHVVYAFNLGAFALGSLKEVRAEVGATVWGIGAGGASKSVNNAEKKGDVLTSCTGETARETATCRVPIRLTLREISNGENPDAVAARAPETPDALNLAGKVDQKLKMSEEAHGRYKAALERMQARDGKACLKELNAYDKLDPKNASTGARSPLAFMRGTCVMMSGMCDAGKVQLRKAYEATNQIAAEHIDGVVDSNASTYCQGGSMSPRDQLLKASHDLQLGATTKKDVAFCRSASDTVKHLSTTVKANGDEDHAYQMATNEMSNAMNLAGCYGRAGDCSLAFKEWHVGQERLMGGAVKTSEYVDRANFARSLPACKTWVESVPMSPRDQLVKAIHGLQEASSKQPDTATCRTQIDAIVALRGRVDASVPEAAAAREPGLSTMGMQCFAKAGDCTNAYRMFMSAGASSYPENQRKQIFEASVPSCKGK